MQLQIKYFPQNSRLKTIWSAEFLEDTVPQRWDQADPGKDDKAVA